MGEVEEIWSEKVDLGDMTAVDFERRGESMAVYDKFGEVCHIIDGLVDYWDVDHSAAIDRAIRIYLSWIEENEDVDITDEDIASLIPPSYWIEEFEPIEIDDKEDDGEGRYYFSTTVTVNKMVKRAVEEGVADSASAFTIDALQFVSK